MNRFLLFLFSLFLVLSSAYSDIYVGFGQQDITPPISTPSAGYRKRGGQGMIGTHDPLLATALIPNVIQELEFRLRQSHAVRRS